MPILLQIYCWFQVNRHDWLSARLTIQSNASRQVSALTHRSSHQWVANMQHESSITRIAATAASHYAGSCIGFKAGVIIGSPLGPGGALFGGIMGFAIGGFCLARRTYLSDCPVMHAVADSLKAPILAARVPDEPQASGGG